MAFPSTRYIESPSIQNYFVDHDSGFPLAAGVVTFYRDVERTVLKPIYQQVQLADNTYDFIQLPNPITLNSVGTYDDGNGNDINVFLYPHVGSPLDVTVGALDLYFVTVYSSDGRLQETREAWPPNAENNASTSSSFDGTDNVILNPQFVDVYFMENASTGTFVYNVSTSGEVSSIAPGWDFITEGTGTITVSQVEISDTSATSNPPYALNIQLGVGVTSCHLTQRIYSSPRFLKDNILSGYFIAKANTAATPFLTLNYKPSNSNSSTLLQQICAGSALVGSFNSIFNTTGVTITIVNPDTAPLGYVDIYLDIPPLSDIQVSSFQVISVANAETAVDFIELSTPQQINQQYNYDKEAIFYKPISSYLVGWDFVKNPAQFGTTGSLTINGGLGQYVCDQTILWQSANNATTYSLITGTDSYGSLVITAAANTQVALIQYLDVRSLYNMAFTNLSAGILANTNQASLPITISLWYTTNAGLPSVGSGLNFTLLNGTSALNANGYPTSVVAGWTEIVNEFQNNFVASVALNFYGLSGWIRDQIPFNATFFAIVVGTGTLQSGNYLGVASVSLVPGDIPTIPAPQTTDEVLRECQRYYYSSFLSGVAPVQNAGTNTGEFYALATAGGNALNSFSVRFPTPMRKTPVNPPIFYNPVAANAFIRDFDAGADFFTTALKANTLTANGFIVNGTSPFATVNGNDIGVHFTADARLGII